MTCYHCKEEIQSWQVGYFIGDGEKVHFDCQTIGFKLQEQIKSGKESNRFDVVDVAVVGKGKDSISVEVTPKVRKFSSGATRDTDENKLDLEGFLSPIVLQAYAEYMNENRVQSDGKTRPSDNWQLGIDKKAYMKSGYRHFFDWWLAHRGYANREGMKKALCGLMFNTMGYLFELLTEELKEKNHD